MISDHEVGKLVEIPALRSRFTIIAFSFFVLFALSLYLRPNLYSFVNDPSARAFYYWKTEWNPTRELTASIRESGVRELYLRFFDVQWNDSLHDAHPVSPLAIRGELPRDVEIIPVIYLVNSVFLKIPYAEVERLAERVRMKIDAMAKIQKIQIHQIQLDCDWTDSTRKKYFHFLELLRGPLNPDHLVVSSTIRLHQVKYFARTGVPPVDRGMLMFYNFGRIQATREFSSIFNVQDAEKYSPYISRYSLPLDVALPLFSWVVHSRDGKVLELLDKTTAADLSRLEGMKPLSEVRYTATKSIFYHGKYFDEGDQFLIEDTNPETTNQAADLALKGASWRKSFKTVALFDLDERNLNRYGVEEIEKIFKKF